jgi:hypothetical protein
MNIAETGLLGWEIDCQGWEQKSYPVLMVVWCLAEWADCHMSALERSELRHRCSLRQTELHFERSDVR